MMTCHQCESQRHEQEGQSRILRQSEFSDRSIQYTSTMQGLEGIVPIIGAGELILFRRPCGLSQSLSPH